MSKIEKSSKYSTAPKNAKITNNSASPAPEKKTIHGRGGLWAIIISSFAFAIIDMLFMRGIFTPIFGVIGASLIAFALATVANISALLWGMEAGKGRSGRSFFWSWVVMGLVYAGIRGYAIYQAISTDGATIENIMMQTLEVVILTISFVGTGTLIKWAAAELWDKDIQNYLNSKKDFEEQNSDLANNKAAIWEMVKTLENYDENYRLLDKQYLKHREGIRKVEHSVMNQIVMKTIVNYPIDPLDAEQVMNNVLEKRDKINEKAHSI